MAESVKIVRTVRDLRKVTAKWRKAGKTVALVPTMGALHAGHISLVRLAKKKADKAVVSIFVNPTQFAPHEDLARYPRDEAGDLEKLAKVGADLVWSPSVEEMYPEGTSTRIEAGSAAADLEGASAPTTSAALRRYAASYSIRSRPISRSSARRTISSSRCSGRWFAISICR